MVEGGKERLVEGEKMVRRRREVRISVVRWEEMEDGGGRRGGNSGGWREVRGVLYVFGGHDFRW